MEEAIRRYRERYPAARRWAAGSYKVRHSEQTQSRIFRMAEQLRVREDLPDLRTFFSMLEALDDVVDAETSPSARPSQWSASAAALVGYKILFGKPAPMQDHDWPSSFDRVADGEAELAAIGLQAQGFDPIVIDGLDPAAYLWAFYEMHERQGACADVTRLHQHPATQPRCIAVVRRGPIRQRERSLGPAQPSRDLAGVAG